MEILKPGRPPGWEEPKMTAYFEAMWANTVATFAQKTESHRLCRIDDLMFDLTNGWSGGSPTAQSIVPLLMYFRSHSAFRGACALCMSGATVEGMAVLRQCLEFAGYAALVHNDPALASVWWDRDQTEDDEKKVRRAFTHGGERRYRSWIRRSLPYTTGSMTVSSSSARIRTKRAYRAT
jgi:hypothetical protein